MSRIKSLLFVLALAAPMPLASVTVTYAVGTCLPKLTSFSTIQGALNATPAPNVVKVCPGNYGEQIVIGNPVTVEGVRSANGGEANILVPSGGLKVNATNDFGQAMAAQVFVQSGGPVNLTNLTVDGYYNAATGSTNVVGVFYHGSSGTLNQLVVQNQNGNGRGYGIWLAGGIPAAYVTVENSNLQWFDAAGLYLETNSSLSELSATIKGNGLSSTFANSNEIQLIQGLTASVTENLVTAGYGGIVIDGGQGTVSKNTVASTPLGIDLETDEVSVTYNKVYNTLGGYGIGVIANSAVASVTGNTISQTPIGIFLECKGGTNVHANTILDAFYGLYETPAAVGSNTYYNVKTINAGGC